MARGKLTDMQVEYTELVAAGMSEHEAAAKVGYGVEQAKQAVYKMRRNKRVVARIERLKQDIAEERVMCPQELLEFWSEGIRDPAISVAQRTEMSKLLAKAQGMFVDKREVKTENATQSVLVIPEVKDWEKFWEENHGNTKSNRTREERLGEVWGEVGSDDS